MTIYSRIFSASVFEGGAYYSQGQLIITLGLVGFFVATEWVGREGAYAIEKTFAAKHRSLRWTFYSLLIFLTGLYMHRGGSPFIYFQF